MIRALSSSLSLRLLGIFVVTATLVIVILVSLFTRGLSAQWVRSIRPHLVQYVQYIQEDLGTPPDPARADTLARRLPVDIHIYRDDHLVHATTGSLLDLDNINFEPVAKRWRKRVSPDSDHAQENRPLPLPSDLVPYASKTSRGDRQRILRITSGDYTIYFDLREPRPRHGRFSRFNEELLLALALLALVLGASYLLIRRQLSPIRQIQKGVGIMSEGNLNHRIDCSGNSDLDQLSNSIDAMASRLQDMLDAKRQLLIAISHELRSPITRARINTELLPDSRQRERLMEDLSDMERMIRDIMESEQLQSRHSVLNREQLDLAELFDEELQHIAPDAMLRLDKAADFHINGDAARLRILLRNLVLNAQQHGKSEDGSVQLDVTLRDTGDQLTLIIEDQGPGIGKEHLSEISAPFYRPDASRSRETGGFGLGLTLARLIAEAHGGSLTILSDPENHQGTRVVVHLPR